MKHAAISSSRPRWSNKGLRAVYEPDAVCIEETNRQSNKEMKMRVRIIAQTFTDLWRHLGMMNPFKSGFYAIQLLSHKVMRYLVPFFLIAIFASSGALAGAQFYRIVFSGPGCLLWSRVARVGVGPTWHEESIAGAATVFRAGECRVAPRLVPIYSWRALCALGADPVARSANLER